MSKSFGEILIGTTFNPSGQDDVQYVKNEFAKLANLVQTNFEDKIEKSQEKILENLPDIDKEQYLTLEDENSIELDVLYGIRDAALTNLVNAQMSVVKLLTFKNQ